MTQTTIKKRLPRKTRSQIHVRPLKLGQGIPVEQEVRIEIVPLIDVIFCILTFFILGAVGLSRQQAMELELPKAGSGSPQMREMLVVSLDDFSQVYVEKQLVNRNQLFDAIKNYHQFNPNGVMVLHASRNASYNDVIQVLDMLKQVGGDRVALATLPGESNPGNNWSNPTANPLPSESGLPGTVPNGFPQTIPSNQSQGFGTIPTTPPNSTLPGVPTTPPSTPPTN
ncbi:ExbD/TolR family protein [Aphanothece sacrum]|nr:biopolymer transporter ExbD [Aphanothece sacrum]